MPQRSSPFVTQLTYRTKFTSSLLPTLTFTDTYRHILSHALSPTNRQNRRSSCSIFSELTPLSLLDFYIPDHSHLPAGVEIIYDKAGDIHAYRFQPGVQMYRFPAARLFVHCRFFPEEFSLLFTFKTDRKSLQTDQCIVALMPESSRSKVKVGIRLRRGRIGVDFTESSGKRRILTEFRSPHLFDQRWHTVVLSVTADRVGLRVDCGKRKFRRLRRSFPSLIDTTDDNIHLGNCNSVRRGQYTVRWHSTWIFHMGFPHGFSIITFVFHTGFPYLNRHNHHFHTLNWLD